MSTETRRHLRVDTTAIIDAMEMAQSDPFRSYLDLDTGEVAVVCLERMSFDRPDPVEQQIHDDTQRFAEIPRVESRAEYLVMEEFAEQIEDDEIRARALDALQGRGAFSRFRNVVYPHPELREAWLARRDAWLVTQVTSWLHDLDIEPEHRLPSRLPPPAPSGPRRPPG